MHAVLLFVMPLLAGIANWVAAQCACDPAAMVTNDGMPQHNFTFAAVTYTPSADGCDLTVHCTGWSPLYYGVYYSSTVEGNNPIYDPDNTATLAYQGGGPRVWNTFDFNSMRCTDGNWIPYLAEYDYLAVNDPSDPSTWITYNSIFCVEQDFPPPKCMITSSPIFASFIKCEAISMDTRQSTQASTLVHLASAFGFTTNLVAFLTIRFNSSLHTSFGIICACLATNNVCLLTLNSIWYLMPDSETFKAGSPLSRAIGMVSLTLWLFGNRCHLLISINRLIAIISPFTSRKYMTNRGTSIAIFIVALSAMLQSSPLIIVEDLLFFYDKDTMQWSVSTTENTQYNAELVNNCLVAIELLSIVIIDIVTIVHLRMYHAKVALDVASNFSSANASQQRSREIRLFKQSLSQSIPLLVEFASFSIIMPCLSDVFAKFCCTTLMWHFLHGVDGLIIDIFHARLEVFKRKKKLANDVVLTST